MNACILFIWTDRLLTFLALLAFLKSPDQLFCRMCLDLAVAVSSWAESEGQLVSYSGEAGPVRASHRTDARVGGTREPLARLKEDSAQGDWKLSIKKTKTVASGPITFSFGGRNAEAVAGLIFLGSETTADADCSPEIKRCLLLGRKAVTNLDSILKKQRHYFADKVPSSKSYSFSSSHVWM